MSPISPEIETKRNLRLSIGAGLKLLYEKSDAAKVQHIIVVRTGRKSVTEYLQFSLPFAKTKAPDKCARQIRGYERPVRRANSASVRCAISGRAAKSGLKYASATR